MGTGIMEKENSTQQLSDNCRHDDPVLQEIVRRLVEAYHPERIFLFGSRARGEAGPDSDYDILVVIPDDAPESLRSSHLAYEVLRGTGVATDVLIWRHAPFQQREQLKSSLPATVIEEGALLYAA